MNGTMGKNDWYISPVTLTCTYDHDMIAHVYYEYENYSGEYTEPFTIDNQGGIELLWSAVDYEGNIENLGNLMFRIDYTPPYIDLSVEKIGYMKWLFSAIVDDELSGVIKVEFYLDGLFLGNITSTPYEYIWTGSGNHTVCAIGYDAAGLNASSSMNTPYNLNQIQNILLHRQMIRVFQNLILHLKS